MTIPETWSGRDSDVAKAVDAYSAETLAAYREAHRLVLEHANMERAAIEGGYGRRQLFELVQNGADELVGGTGKVAVVLTEEVLYCANEGRPLTVEGAGALLSSYLSPKRGVEIGRFGLGFKSVLAVTSRPELFSRSGSIIFDPVDAAERIRAVVPRAERTPILRIASSIDPAASAEDDETLAELMSWATTVVRLVRNTVDSSWLPTDLQEFPSQFLLFSPHVAELVLDDREQGRTRVLTATQAGDEVVLTDEGDESRWRVFAARHTPSAEARLDAGAMADRDRIPLVWAVPTRNRGRGEFWAFFPTSDRTTLSGVVNAPWKLSDDRTTILPGPFNDELVRRVSLLVLEHLEVLCAPEDPGVLLELLPARGREAACLADELLTGYVNDSAKNARSIPNQVGVLMHPSKISLHPQGIPRQVLELWSQQPTRPVDWAHPSVDTTIRRARVEMYMAPREAETLAAWLEALVPEDQTLAGSIAATTVASALVRFDPTYLPEARQARIFLDDRGVLGAATSLFRSSASHSFAVEAKYIHPELESALEKSQLENLGIREVEPERLLAVHLHAIKPDSPDVEWDELWTIVRECRPTQAVETIERTIRNPLALRGRTCAGNYRSLSLLLLPGEIVDDDPGEDAGCVVDTRFHARELGILRHLGVPSGPSREGGSRSEPWFTAYRREVQIAYLESLKGLSSPNPELLDFQARPFAGPLEPLVLLKSKAAAAYTRALIKRTDDLEPWIFAHTSMTRYPERLCDNPVVRMLRKRGQFDTQLGICDAATAVGPGLESLAAILPVADVPADIASALAMPQTVDQLRPEDWERGLERVIEADDDRVIGMFYAAAARAGIDRPTELRCRAPRGHANRPPVEVMVSHDPDLLSVLDKTGEPYVRVASSSERDILIERWNLVDAGTSVRSEIVSTPNGDPEALGDKFPMLRARLDAAQRELLLQPCASLRIERFTANGRIGEDQHIVVDGETIRYLSELENPRLLRLLDEKLMIGLDNSDIEAILRNLDAKRVQALRAEIRGAPDDASRLLRAVGADELRAHVPRATIEAVEAADGDLDEHELADLALTVHGPRALQEHTDVLEERGLEPPTQWHGSRAAVSFVRDLGFGTEYAGFETRNPDKEEKVEGPPEIGPLHDYQVVVVDEIRKVLRGDGGRRGLLSLPTGAGKTRVTIEALIDALADGQLGSPILWIAQTQELCEQAVETWSELWRGKGPRGDQLTISRLYASFEATEAEHGHQVVVATDAKLAAGVLEKHSYDWLKHASCVVVDEAHTSIGRSYTEMLEWQGLGARQRKEDARDIPLIGLTATPFRGTNTTETKRLVARYGGWRLDLKALGSEDAYPELQRIGILSQVDQALVPGSEMELSEGELAELNKFQRLPETATRKLAGDAERNRRLLEHVGELPDDWPVLLFAVSVEHAHAMAALLRRAGISAAAISADTDKGARRHYIESFRKGALRVLANYNVLAAGFDAPKVRAVYIARPTYVPNAYQQMIGRGLRGPRNGGTDRCLLVNVADNVVRFEGKLAFHEFDYLWESGAEETPD